jgi:hypothetical protein
VARLADGRLPAGIPLAGSDELILIPSGPASGTEDDFLRLQELLRRLA